MSKIVTYKGKLPIGEQEKIHLSTNNGLTGYRIKDFRVIASNVGAGTSTNVAKIYLTDQTGNITSTIDFSDTDLIGVSYANFSSSVNSPTYETIIFDKETFNQDIFVYITDPDGGTTPSNFYIELEKFPIDLNTSTYHTLKNIRSKTQI